MLAVEVALDRGSFSLEAELEVAAGECVALAGPSGAGKSTLLRLIAGLLRPDRGAITLGDELWLDAASGRSVPSEERRIGFVFQDYALFPTMPAWRNVAYGIRGRSRGERRERSIAALERFGLGGRAMARPRDLSGGERQRVALARALACEPRLLLLDEPLSALDARTGAEASQELARVLEETDVPSVIVTHDFAEAALLADRVVVLDRGAVVQEGTAAELAAAPASGFVADLTGAVVLRGVASPGPDGLTLVDLEGGGRLLSTDAGSGPVAASVFPWEVSLEPEGVVAEGSALNHLHGEVATVTEFGNRARVGLLTPQLVVAEVTSGSISRLGLEPGSRAVASWKATATRLAGV